MSKVTVWLMYTENGFSSEFSFIIITSQVLGLLLLDFFKNHVLSRISVWYMRWKVLFWCLQLRTDILQVCFWCMIYFLLITCFYLGIILVFVDGCGPGFYLQWSRWLEETISWVNWFGWSREDIWNVLKIGLQRMSMFYFWPHYAINEEKSCYSFVIAITRGLSLAT